MLEFHLDPDACRRVVSTVVALATRARALTPARAGAIQSLAVQLGLDFAAVAELSRAPQVEPHASRVEAEATWLAAAAVLRAGIDAAERAALAELGGRLELGLAVRDLEVLAGDPGALSALKPRPGAGPTKVPSERVRLDAPARPGKPDKAPRPERPAKPARAGRAPSDSDAAKPASGGARSRKAEPAAAKGEPGQGRRPLPGWAIPAGVGAGLLALVLALALVLGGGKPPATPAVGTPAAGTPAAGTPPGKTGPAAPGPKLDTRALEAEWRRLADQPQAPARQLMALEEKLAALATRAKEQGDVAAAGRIAQLTGSKEWRERWEMARGEVMRQTTEALERELEEGELARAEARLAALPAGLARDEAAWVQGWQEKLRRWRAYALEVRAFLDGQPKGVEGLQRAWALHRQAVDTNCLASPAYATDLTDWLRQQRGAAGELLELLIRQGKQQQAAQAAETRKLLELVVGNLGGFLEGLPPERVLELLAALPGEQLADVARYGLTSAAWKRLPTPGWFAVLCGLEPEALVAFAVEIPRPVWALLTGPQLTPLLAKLDPLQLIRLVLRFTDAQWLGIPAAELGAQLRRVPARIRPLLLPLIPEPRRGELAGLLGEAAPPPPPAAGESLSSGTGFYVGPRHVLTNQHVVGQSQTVEVHLGEASFQGRVVQRDARLDLALIEVPTAGEPLVLCEPSISPGRACFAYGYGTMGGRAGLLLTTRGSISAVEPGSGWLIFDAHINPGNSGGPLVDAEGRWVGVVAMKTRSVGEEEDRLGIAIHGATAAAWLRAQGLEVQRAPEAAKGDVPPDEQVRRSVVRILSRG